MNGLAKRLKKLFTLSMARSLSRVLSPVIKKKQLDHNNIL